MIFLSTLFSLSLLLHFSISLLLLQVLLSVIQVFESPPLSFSLLSLLSLLSHLPSICRQGFVFHLPLSLTSSFLSLFLSFFFQKKNDRIFKTTGFFWGLKKVKERKKEKKLLRGTKETTGSFFWRKAHQLFSTPFLLICFLPVSSFCFAKFSPHPPHFLSLSRCLNLKREASSFILLSAVCSFPSHCLFVFMPVGLFFEMITVSIVLFLEIVIGVSFNKMMKMIWLHHNVRLNLMLSLIFVVFFCFFQFCSDSSSPLSLLGKTSKK